MFTLLLAIAILITGSAFCSSAEAALFSVPQAKIQGLKKQGSRQAESLAHVKDTISSSIGAIVILNNIFNIVGPLYVGILAQQVFGSQGYTIALFSAVLTFLVIMLGEILPKNFGERFALRYGLLIAPLILLLVWIFKPLLIIIDKLNHLIFGARKMSFVSEEEIKSMIEQGRESQSIEQDEHTMIHNVFRLNDKTAKDIMTPRIHLEGLNSNESLGEQHHMLAETAFSRLPVFSDDYDTIVGFVLVKQALAELSQGKERITPEELTHEIIYLKETTRVDTLMVIFQKKRIHMAVVQDEFGGTSGIVTLEDALEELVGEIVDETDQVTDMRDLPQDSR